MHEGTYAATWISVAALDRFSGARRVFVFISADDSGTETGAISARRR
jgi:hypothetical protein